jgi:hypothetical protein
MWTLTTGGMEPMLSPMLVADLADFVTRHRSCCQFTGDATEPEPSGYVLSVGCSCGVTFLRWVTAEDAAYDLGESDLATGAR